MAGTASLAAPVADAAMRLFGGNAAWYVARYRGVMDGLDPDRREWCDLVMRIHAVAHRMANAGKRAGRCVFAEDAMAALQAQAAEWRRMAPLAGRAREMRGEGWADVAERTAEWLEARDICQRFAEPLAHTIAEGRDAESRVRERLALARNMNGRGGASRQPDGE